MDDESNMPGATFNLPPWRGANKPAYRWTRLDGRQTTWTPPLVARLAVLWAFGYHHETISTVLGVGPYAAASKAHRIGLPARGRMLLSRDLDAARRLDALEKPAPKVLKSCHGRELVGRQCSLSGMWFYGQRGVHTSPEAKLTQHYREMYGV